MGCSPGFEEREASYALHAYWEDRYTELTEPYDWLFAFADVQADDVLTVRLADKAPLGKDIIGCAIIPVRAMAAVPGQFVRRAWPCLTDNGDPAGSVDLTLRFQSPMNELEHEQ